jgi:hypothetical protein
MGRLYSLKMGTREAGPIRTRRTPTCGVQSETYLTMTLIKISPGRASLA